MKSSEKKKVLLVDSDPQDNASSGLGVRALAEDKTVYEVLIGDVDADKATGLGSTGRDARTAVEQSAPGISAANALFAHALLGPRHVTGRMSRLHGCDDAELSEPRDVVCVNHLGVRYLVNQAAVAIGFSGRFKRILTRVRKEYFIWFFSIIFSSPDEVSDIRIKLKC